MKKSELRQIISEEIQKLNEAQYTDQSGAISSLLKSSDFKSILDNKTLKFIKSSDVRLFLKTFTDYGVVTDGKQEVVFNYKKPEIVEPLSKASKLAKELYNRDISGVHVI